MRHIIKVSYFWPKNAFNAPFGEAAAKAAEASETTVAPGRPVALPFY
jgi:hypothetical protein